MTDDPRLPPGKIRVSGTGDASGQYANTGVHIGDVYLTGRPPVVIEYRKQVERIAPPQLHDREAELAELAEFAVSPEAAGRYRWWQAAPWAGKSALMATFVLNPPPGVCVVSFFITARLAGQADRAAFIENVRAQLLAIAGQDMPPFLTPATREAHLLGLLDQAALLCQERGEVLLLLVDGLDEDRSVTNSPYAYSIANLLPTTLKNGMRVIVAGRPDPPIPRDVDRHHPLRDPAVVRPLSAYSHAQELREGMEDELHQLLDGGPVEQDMLGLLTSAGGGLTAADLTELIGSGLSIWQVEHHLRAVAGRSFTRRDSPLGPHALPEIYLLGHEQLQHTAVTMLGPPRLANYRTRIHAWADGYRVQGWPADTPEYLLRGYHTMLLAQDDLDRATALCTDARRHDRLLKIAGGDSVARAQIVATLDTQAARTSPDLNSIVRLAVHREHLTKRNILIPHEIPALWVRLGHPIRAANLLDSLTNPERRMKALILAGRALHEGGQHDQAMKALDEAEDVALSATSKRQSLIRELVKELVDADFVDRAWAVTETMPNNFLDNIYMRRTVTAAAVKLARTGRHRDAVDIITSAPSSYPYEDALGSVTDALIEKRMFDQAIEVISTILSSAHRGNLAREKVAIALVGAGLHERALTFADSINQSDKEQVMSVIAESLAQAGLYNQATRLASAIKSRFLQSRTVSAIARILVEAGLQERADKIVESSTDPYQQCHVGATVAAALVEVGSPDRAGRLLTRLTSSTHISDHETWANWALAPLFKALVGTGQRDRALAIFDQLMTSARSAQNRDSDHVLKSGIQAMAEAGLYDKAAELAVSVRNREEQARLLDPIITGLVKNGEYDRAIEVAESFDGRDFLLDWTTRTLAQAFVAVGRQDLLIRAAVTNTGRKSDFLRTALYELKRGRIAPESHRKVEDAARSIADTEQRDMVLAALAVAFAGSELHEQAENVARTITDQPHRRTALTAVAGALTSAGHHERATDLLTQVVAETQATTDFDGYDRTLTAVVEALLRARMREQLAAVIDRGAMIAEAAGEPLQKCAALAAVGKALARSGRRDESAEAFNRAAVEAQAIDALLWRSQALSNLAESMASVGLHEQALEVTWSITNSLYRTRTLAILAAASVETAPKGKAAQALARALTAVRTNVDVAEAEHSSLVWSYIGVDPTEEQGRAAAVLVEAFVATGRPGKAMEASTTITNAGQKNRALTAVVKGLTAIGRHSEAAEVYDSITEDHWRVRALVRMSEISEDSQAESLLDRAATDAKLAIEAHERITTLISIAEALFDRGKRDEAVSMLNRVEDTFSFIDDRGARHRVMMSAVETMVRVGLRQQAVRLVVDVLQGDSWPTALPGLCAVSAEAALTLSNESDALLVT